MTVVPPALSTPGGGTRSLRVGAELGGAVEEDVGLREVRPADIDRFFEFERDPVAAHRAAFTAEDPNDRAAFDRHWRRILADPNVRTRTVVYRGEAVGYVAFFELLGRPSVAYWIERGWWGRGIATRALQRFLGEIGARPDYARVVHDNLASQHVLRSCGFRPIGTDRGFAPARGAEVEEQIWQLDGSPGPASGPAPVP